MFLIRNSTESHRIWGRVLSHTIQVDGVRDSPLRVNLAQCQIPPLWGNLAHVRDSLFLVVGGEFRTR